MTHNEMYINQIQIATVSISNTEYEYHSIVERAQYVMCMIRCLLVIHTERLNA